MVASGASAALAMSGAQQMENATRLAEMMRFIAMIPSCCLERIASLVHAAAAVLDNIAMRDASSPGNQVARAGSNHVVRMQSCSTLVSFIKKIEAQQCKNVK
jgi:hypothetical protein